MDNGSYLVFRRLRQDVVAYQAFLAAEVERIRQVAGSKKMTTARLAALLVGGWPKGIALIRSPGGDKPDPMGDRCSVNHFGFADAASPIVVSSDPHAQREEGLVAAAELRTVEGAPADLPRAAARRHLGSTVPPAPAEQAADDGQRGLLFVCYQTSIGEQFELLTRAWMNRTESPKADPATTRSSARTRPRLVSAPGSCARTASITRSAPVRGGSSRRVGDILRPVLSLLRRLAASGVGTGLTST